MVPDSGAHDGRDTGTTTDSGSDAADTGTTADTGTDAGDAGQMFTLTVRNDQDWCNITVNGVAEGMGDPITVQVPAGVTTIVASPISNGFTIGADPWFGVDQNDGGAAPGVDSDAGGMLTSTATVTVSGNHCVYVCCPFSDGTGCQGDLCPPSRTDNSHE